MNGKTSRVLWAAASAIFLILMLTLNGMANALPLNGVNTGQLSDEIPNLFVPAGLTFAIWGLIYLLLIGYVIAVFKAATSTSGLEAWAPADGMLFSANAALNAVWILAWHWRIIPLSLLIMAGILGTLIVMMERNHKRVTGAAADARGGPILRFFLRIPILVYLGWICVATIANVTALLVTMGWNGWGLDPVVWTILVIAVGAAVGIFLAAARGAVSASLVVVWAYAGVILKRSGIDAASSLPIIVAASTGIAAVALAIVIRLFAKARGGRVYTTP